MPKNYSRAISRGNLKRDIYSAIQERVKQTVKQSLSYDFMSRFTERIQ